MKPGFGRRSEIKDAITREAETPVGAVTAIFFPSSRADFTKCLIISVFPVPALPILAYIYQ